MEGFLSLLVSAAFFYLMMRFGCGAHMVHGHAGGHGTSRAIEGSSKDPVCGMEVPPGEGYARMYEGSQYRFCSRNCLDRFDAEPQRFIPVQGAMR